MSTTQVIPDTLLPLTTDDEQRKAQKRLILSHYMVFRDQITDFRKEYPDPPTNGEKFSMAELQDRDMVVKRPLNKQSVVDYIKACIQLLDEQIAERLNDILHDQQFQALEASWRGLRSLVFNTETGTLLKLRLMDVTKKELREDIEKATEFDQSALFKKIYEEEYGTFGGNPFTVLVGDYYFSRSNQDLSLLEGISHVAAAAHAPFLAAASPDLFGLDSFRDLGGPRDLAKIFESMELIKWRSFRESDDSRYVTLTLPHVLLRLPYGRQNPLEGISFEEAFGDQTPTPVRHDKTPDDQEITTLKNTYVPKADYYLWGNAAYKLAERITNAFAMYHWCAAIRGVEGGGLVENLPIHLFSTEAGDIAFQCPTELAITDRRENELSKLGFIALCHRKGDDKAAFFGGQTVNKAPVFFDDKANANANLSSMLPYMLAASRFAHYIKVIMRDKIGSFMTKENVANYLNNWISNYVLLNDDAPQSVKASYPLREARVDVVDNPGKPGSYKATVFLRPHFQLDELTVSIRLVAELPPPAK